MKKINNFSILFYFIIISLSTKWVISEIYFDHNIIIDVISNIKDQQYFPIIISFSNLDFNPTYLDNLNDYKTISFPLYGVLLHGFFYSFFGFYAFIILEFFLKIIFFFIIYKTFQIVFEDKSKSLHFCIFIILSIFIIKFFAITTDVNIFHYFYNPLNDNFGNRVPRPLVTGIFYFLFYFQIFKLRKKININIDFKYFLIITFLLSCFVNSFFYYFINFSILLIILLYLYEGKKISKILLNNKKKLIMLILFFLIFISPFVTQIYFGENDYSQRIGVIELSFNQKIELIKYYFLSLFKLEFLILLISTILIHLYLKFSFKFRSRKIDKINIFFYFILASIISPPIFFLASPLIVSIYHFLDILIFACLFYVLLTSFYLLYDRFFIYLKILNLRLFTILLLITFTSGNFFIDKKIIFKERDSRAELNKIQNFLQDKKLSKTNFKLFTNDLSIMNLWLLNENSQLVVSDGFTSALTNHQIEFNLINTLKDFYLTEDDFKSIISYNRPQYRDPLFMTLFIYKYQANSLYTYSKLNNYNEEFVIRIKNTSPFHARSQILPQDEKERLLKLFQNHKIDKDLLSDYVILNNSILPKQIEILNKNYIKMYSSKKFKIFKRAIKN